MEISRDDFRKIMLTKEMQEKDIFFELGKALILSKRNSSSQALGTEFTEDELDRIGREFFRENNGYIRKVFCKEWKLKDKENLKDLTQVISILVSAIFLATNITSTYVNIAILLAGLITKRGIDAYCTGVS
jgi:hypothetical protein